MKQRTIEVNLPDGDPSGIRVANMHMSPIQAIAFRRNQLPDVRKEFPALARTGVYILIGTDDNEPDTQFTYIGESEDVGKRLDHHRTNRAAQATKGFWADTVVLISIDEFLTKSPARYVESCLIRSAEGNPRWSVRNTARPSGDVGKLTAPRRDAMDEYVRQAKILVGTLGWDLFREMRGSAQEEMPIGTPPSARVGSDIHKFTFEGKGFKAEMHVGPSGDLIVKEGSKARIQTTKSIASGTVARRQRLLKKGVLRQDSDSLVFTSDYIFRSPSAAAATVKGASMSGPVSWRLADGRTYGAWESGEEAPAETAPAAKAAPDVPIFFFAGDGFAAEMHVDPSGVLIVKAGSTARSRTTESVARGTVARRERLLQEGILHQDGDSLVFTSDYVFSSPSTAAEAVRGGSTNGRTAWKLHDPDGRTYGEWESSKG